jgi:hypothetical protein
MTFTPLNSALSGSICITALGKRVDMESGSQDPDSHKIGLDLGLLFCTEYQDRKLLYHPGQAGSPSWFGLSL